MNNHGEENGWSDWDEAPFTAGEDTAAADER